MELEAEQKKKPKADAEAKKVADAAAAASVKAENAANEVPPSEVLNKLSTPPCELRLTRNADPKHLFLQSTAAGNKKVPKFTVLLMVHTDCMLSSKATSGPIFEVANDTQVFLKESQKVAKVREAMKSDDLEMLSVFEYNPFPAGKVPKVLVRADTKVWRLDLSHPSYQDTRNDIETAIELARTAPGLQAMWIMKKGEAEKQVKPAGIVIIATSQVVIPGFSAHKFLEP